MSLTPEERPTEERDRLLAENSELKIRIHKLTGAVPPDPVGLRGQYQLTGGICCIECGKDLPGGWGIKVQSTPWASGGVMCHECYQEICR